MGSIVRGLIHVSKRVVEGHRSFVLDLQLDDDVSQSEICDPSAELLASNKRSSDLAIRGEMPS